MPTPITINVNFIDLTGNAIQGYMQASIVSPTGVYDLYVNGTGIILPKIVTSNVGTSVSIQVWGNDVVVDASDNAKDTYYTVNLFDTTNKLLWSASYLFTGAGPINLVGLPILNPVPVGPPLFPLPTTVPGGNNTDIQFNNSGTFAGSDNFTFNSATNVVSIAGSQVAVDLPFGVDTGVVNAAIVNPTPAVTLTLGASFNFTTPNPNTGAVTLNASGTGVKNLTNEDGSALVTGDLLAGVVYGAVYDGTEWLLSGYDSVPASRVALNGSVFLLAVDPANGFNSSKGAPLTLAVKNPPATRQPLLAFGNPTAGSGAFFGFDNDNVFVCATIGCRLALLSGTAPEIFDLVSVVQNVSFGGDDLFIQPSLGGANKAAGSMLNILSGDGNSQLTFNFQNNFLLSNIKAATNSVNQSSLNLQLNGTYWTGSASAVDSYNFQNVVASGTNPSTTLLITHTGSSGSPLVSTGSIAFTCGQLHAGQTFFGGNIELTSAPATGGGNVSSTSYQLQSAWWDGAASHFSVTSIQDTEGAGTNPTDTTVISNSGAFAWAGVSVSGALSATTLTATAGTPTGTGSNLGLGTTSGFGNGTAGQAVTTTLKNTGSGPTTATTVVKYLEIDLGGTKYWVPLMQ